ncbi:MAG: oxidoreductase [Candidatus Saccharibacteria bacterium]|nr:oxidoreductase [Candidatus Saccharibacteria bacterium]
MNPLKAVDELLNSITMYRLLVYALSSLALIAIVFSFTGVLTLSGPGLSLSLSTLLVVCFAVNWALAKVWRAMPSTESWLITALILFFILPPTNTAARFLGLVGVGILAMASKYLLAFRRKHIFNPAAIALVIGSLLEISSAIWWVGNKTMFPLLAFVGILILRKLRHVTLALVFVAATLITVVLFNLDSDLGLSSVLQTAVMSSPLVFLGAIMLTEPATMPSTKGWRLVFAALVGVVSVAEVSILDRSITAEMALVAGNALAFMVSPRYKTILEFVRRQPVAPGSTVYDYVFKSSEKLAFQPGQYMELTLPHTKPDTRGNRRVFTIASSPTENDVHFGIKINEQTSSFKRALQTLVPGQKLIGGQIAGGFVLSKKTEEKLLMIAGGIGVTPFRSMAKHLIDSNESRDAVLFYMIASPSELAFKDVFTEAGSHGLKTMPVLSGEAPQDWKGMTGPLSADDFQKVVPDLKHRRVYISGPPGMVDAYKKILVRAGVPRTRIVTDHFSGY